jgi:signal transduction histidine kinase
VDISLKSILLDEVLYGITAVRDMTMQKKLEEQNRLKSEFLANTSHELRTPLNAIIGFADLLVEEIAGPVSDTQKEYLKDILSCARHQLQLINDVLDLSIIEAGKMTFQPEEVDLSRLIEELQNTLHPLIVDKRLQVETVIDPSVKRITPEIHS